MRRFHLAREAQEEIEEAGAYYLQRSKKAKDNYLAQMDRAFARILQRPEQFAPYRRIYRKCVVKVFPYSIYFVDAADAVWVMAVVHDSRRPDYWLGRDFVE